MLNLNSSIKYIKGIGEKRAELFNSLGIFDVDSLLHFYFLLCGYWSDLSDVTCVLNVF